MSRIEEITNQEQLSKLVAENKAVLVDFYADW